MHRPPVIQIRPATPGDKEFLRLIAPRLLVGYAPWRDASRMLATMERFLLENLESAPEKGMIFIAERSDGTQLGVVSIAHHVNFTGERQAYLGELAVVEEVGGRALAVFC